MLVLPHWLLSSVSPVLALSWVTSGSCPNHSNTTSTMQDYITYYLFIPFFLLLILVNPLLISPVSCTQDLLIPIYPIHDFSDCVTGIFSLLTSDDVIRDSCLIDILPSIIHEFQSSPSAILLVCLAKFASKVILVMIPYGFYSLQIYWISTYFSSTISCIKWWRISMCFLWIHTCLLFARKSCLGYPHKSFCYLWG